MDARKKVDVYFDILDDVLELARAFCESMSLCRYYYDSAAGCGACCTLAGACRTLRRTWTGLGLAGLSALSCAGLLLLAAKSPKAGTPLHDVTAGALCGVSLLGAALALLALLAPRCNLGRHRRVHSWITSSVPLTSQRSFRAV